MRHLGRTVLGGALGVVLGALPIHRLHSQVPIPDLGAQPPRAAAGIPRPTAVESQVARIRFGGDTRQRTADGFGVRLVYGRRGLLDDEDEARSPLARRGEVALFVTHAREPRREGDGRWTSAGLALDLRPLEQPLLGRIDPFVSLGGGVLRETRSAWAPPLSWRTPPARLEQTRTGAALLPGAGLRVHVTPRIAVQAEARDLLSLHAPSRHNVAVGTGLRFNLR
jgi:hypothetical protein